MFSSITAFSAPKLRWTVRNAARLRRVTSPVIYSISGISTSIANANCQLSRNIATNVPPSSRILETNSIRPLDSVRLMASESFVIRLIRSPTWLRSWKAIDMICMWLNRPARMSVTKR